eukprot:SAG22_NODE_11630_length_476_cov_0.822281_1_plen_89_part_01
MLLSLAGHLTDRPIAALLYFVLVLFPGPLHCLPFGTQQRGAQDLLRVLGVLYKLLSHQVTAVGGPVPGRDVLGRDRRDPGRGLRHLPGG